MTQLSLLDEGKPNVNTAFFNADGSPRRLFWCSDGARLGGPCPFVGEKEKHRPMGGCCKDLARA